MSVQCESLRSLLPQADRDNELLNNFDDDGSKPETKRDLLKWLEDFGTKDKSNDYLSAIRTAQQACRGKRLRNKVSIAPEQEATPVVEKQPDETNNDTSCPCLKAGLFADGKVPAGCPFAASSQKKAQSAINGDAACPVLTKQASLEVGSPDIQPNVIPGTTVEPGAVSVSGSAVLGTCPIRFLDQHSPEAIAEYFEEHKHELPRSHEICVARFQANDESIRALDAKYGNLVSMIQGLGQKHQPMLPHEPNPEPDEDEPDEAQSKEKIKRWAQAVSEYQGSEGHVDAEEADDEASKKDDERESRFDRSLREIRVGESPSRPWGMHVPPHLLDRRVSTASTLPARVEDVTQNTVMPDTFGARPVRPDMRGSRQPSTLLQTVTEEPASSPVVEFRTRPVGRCPFNHAAAAQPPAAPQIDPHQAVQPGTVDEQSILNEPRNDDTPHHAPPVHITASTDTAVPRAGNLSGRYTALQTPSHSHMTDAARPQRPPPGYTEGQETAHRPVFTNHGVAIISSPDVMEGMADVQNMGTMILGYQADEALRMADSLRKAA